MKNARDYEKKIKKLLSGLKKNSVAPPETDLVRLLIFSVLEADSTEKIARQGMAVLEREFVDFNELRVAPPKDIVDVLGKGFPRARRKAEMLTASLNAEFDKVYQVCLDHLKSLPKRDLRRRLREVGLDAYTTGCLLMYGFGGHAVPVDEDLADCLRMEEYVHPESDIDDIQAFLERVIAQKDGPAAHQRLREYVSKSTKALEKYRQQRQAAALAAEEARLAAEREAAEAAAAEEERKKAREQAAQAKKAAKKKAAKSKARKAARKAAANTADAGGKTPGKKAAAKRPPKKAAPKKAAAPKKTAKKAEKKSAGKRSRKK